MSGICLGLLAAAAPLQAGPKRLRVGLGDRVGAADHLVLPTQLLGADDLVCAPYDLGRGTNNPRIKITKFVRTDAMTSAALESRKRAGFNWICYDIENGKDWNTPAEELADPTRYTIAAAKLTHAAGLKFLVEPNFELIVGRGTRGQQGKLRLTDKHVPSVRMPEVAPYLDGISLQLQRAQADLEQYRELTRRYAGEVRAANPQSLIFVQVTSREISGKKSTPAELMQAIRGVADTVDGIWIHYDLDGLDFATELITRMAEAGYR